MTSSTQAPSPALQQTTVWKDLSVYIALRIALFVVLTLGIKGVALLIESPVPLLVCAVCALLIAFPLSLLVQSSLRARAVGGLSEWDAQRKAHKEWVRKELDSR